MNMSSRWIAAVASAAVVAAAHGQCEPEIVRTIPGAAYSTVIEGSLAYVASGRQGLRILDISDPLDPVPIGSVQTAGRALKVTVTQGVAFVVIEDDTSSPIFDVSDPTDPRLIGSLVTPRPAMGMAAGGTILGVAGGAARVAFLYDISEPASPRYLASVGIGSPSSISSVSIHGSRMYMTAAAGGAVQIVSIRDPEAPVILGRRVLRTGVWDVEVHGSRMYLPHGHEPQPRILDVLDVSDPAAFTRHGSVLFHPAGAGGYASEIAVTGGLAVIAGGPVWEVRLVDVGNPTRPTVVGSIPTPARCWGVAVVGSVAYLANGGAGLQVVDLSPCMPCYADCDRSGALDFADLTCFGELFAAGFIEADCDGSGSLDFFDYLCFQNAFAAGCE